MRRVRQGPVMVAGEPGSAPAAAHSALCLQLLILAACKTLGAHARIQAFRRLRDRFLNERAGPGAGSDSDKYLLLLFMTSSIFHELKKSNTHKSRTQCRIEFVRIHIGFTVE